MTAPDRPDGRLLAVARRYEPAVVTVVIVLVVLLVAPRVTDEGQEARSFAAPTFEPGSGGTDTAADPAEGAPVFSRPPATAARRTPPPATPATASQPSGTGPPPTVATIPPSSPLAPSRPLEVVETGWSGSASELPIAGFDVPDGSLPVSSAFGEPDRHTYLRLTGDQTVLTLELVNHPIGSRFPEDAAVWLCPITEGWEGERAMAPDDAPDYRCRRRVEGEAGDDSWTFDLARFDDPARRNGWVLVAPPESPDFQILFADPTAGDASD